MNRFWQKSPLCACTHDWKQHWELLHQEEDLAKRRGPNWSIASYLGMILLYHIRALLLTFPHWPYSLPELLILKIGRRGFKSFSNHIEEGSLWVSWILETSLMPVMLWHLSWSSVRGIIRNHFPASGTHLPGSLACAISKVKSVSPPHFL